MSLTRAELKKVKSLQTKKGRRITGMFVAEGVRLLEEAQRFNRRPAAIYVSPAAVSDRGSRLAETFRSTGADLYEISNRELSQISSVETSQGLLGVFARPERRLSKLCSARTRNILVCENLSDPGNVGTLCRSALAFDFDLMVLVGQCAEPYAPKTVRSSVGAVFGLPVAEADLNELLEMMNTEDTTLVASSPHGRASLQPILRQPGTRRLVLAIGSEAEGLSESLLSAADYQVRIRHQSKVESLNSGVAGSILMKECYDLRMRRRR